MTLVLKSVEHHADASLERGSWRVPVAAASLEA
jgi:hypothetical protein